MNHSTGIGWRGIFSLCKPVWLSLEAEDEIALLETRLNELRWVSRMRDEGAAARSMPDKPTSEPAGRAVRAS